MIKKNTRLRAAADGSSLPQQIGHISKLSANGSQSSISTQVSAVMQVYQQQKRIKHQKKTERQMRGMQNKSRSFVCGNLAQDTQSTFDEKTLQDKQQSTYSGSNIKFTSRLAFNKMSCVHQTSQSGSEFDSLQKINDHYKQAYDNFKRIEDGEQSTTCKSQSDNHIFFTKDTSKKENSQIYIKDEMQQQYETHKRVNTEANKSNSKLKTRLVHSPLFYTKDNGSPTFFGSAGTSSNINSIFSYKSALSQERRKTSSNQSLQHVKTGSQGNLLSVASSIINQNQLLRSQTLQSQESLNQEHNQRKKPDIYYLQPPRDQTTIFVKKRANNKHSFNTGILSNTYSSINVSENTYQLESAKPQLTHQELSTNIQMVKSRDTKSQEHIKIMEGEKRRKKRAISILHSIGENESDRQQTIMVTQRDSVGINERVSTEIKPPLPIKMTKYNSLEVENEQIQKTRNQKNKIVNNEQSQTQNSENQDHSIDFMLEENFYACRCLCEPKLIPKGQKFNSLTTSVQPRERRQMVQHIVKDNNIEQSNDKALSNCSIF